MFGAASLVLLNKVDLLPYLDFDFDRAIGHLRQVNPEAALLSVSARAGDGLTQWYDWLRRELVTVKLGLFDTAGGRVQVEGDLHEGDQVVVPSP